MENEAENSKDLVPIDWFQKPQKYSLFTYILENISHIIDDLEEKSRLFVIGAMISSGGNYKGHITSTGYFTSEEDLLCRGLFTVGKANFDRMVVVDGNTQVIGKSTFSDYCIFGGKTEIAGKSTIASHLISSGKLKLDGQISLEGNLYADNQTRIKGTVHIENIRSSSIIYAQHELYVAGNIFADEFIFTKGGGEVGSIKANLISIGFRDKRTAKLYHNKVVDRQSLANPINLSRYIIGLVKHSITLKPKKFKTLVIKGNIEAKEIYLSNCVVTGDIVANNITIGENVEVHGQISYSEKLEISAKATSAYNSVKIDSESLLTE